MWRRSLPVVVIFLTCAVVARSSFDDSNPIRLASDRPHDLDSPLLAVIGDARHASSFARFAHKYGKKYDTEAEIKRRFSIFLRNLDLIRSTNKRGLSYRLRVNQFADLSWKEFQSRMLGASQNCSATSRGNHKLTDDILPESKDWRDEGIVSPVKNQGNCGSCWTFSTTGALEAAYHQAFGSGISLSEQQLVDCAGAFNNFGCNGGLPSQAFEYIKFNGGLDTEDAYPYVGEGGVCKFSSQNVGIQVLESVNITTGDEDELKHAVATVRPVSVCYEVVDSFRFYDGGVYTSTTCGSGSMDVNHAVLAVGYGIEDSVPYWLIKNSWGSDWGVNGYFKMEMGKNMCGISTCASYPVVA